MVEYGIFSSLLSALILAILISGSSADMDCGVFRCPNVFTKAYDAVTDADTSKSFCCKSNQGMPYCCDWKDYGAYFVGLDPGNLAIPVGAIIGIVIGGLVLLILMSICCCFCCGICCFRGRKRVITQHHTVAYGKAGSHDA